MKAIKAFILFLILIPVFASAQSWLRAIEGEPTMEYGSTIDDVTVKGGTLLANPLVVSDDETWEKSGNIIVKSLRQISIKFEDGTGMAWGEGSENWVFHIDDTLRKSSDLPDVGPADAKRFAELPTSEPGDDRFLWGMVTLSSVNGRNSEARKAFLTDVVFHKDSKGGLILGVATPSDAEIYVPPVIISLTPSLVSSLMDAKLGIIDFDRLTNLVLPKGLTSFASSTDIAISQKGDGSLVAKGRMEFLLLGWRRLYRNFGEGTKVQIVDVLKTPLELVDGQNQVTTITSGAYVVSNGKWIKIGQNTDGKKQNEK